MTNKCLNCAGNHGTRDCQNRQQPQTPSVSNLANGQGIYKNSSQSHDNSPQQHSQQSASTVNMSTPTLMVNNPLQPGPQQGKQQHPPPPPNHPTSSPIRHNQFNRPFQQPLVPQVSPLMAPPQEYNPQVPPPYFQHYPPTNSPSVDSNESMLARIFHRQRDKKSMTRRKKNEKSTERNVRNMKREKQTRGHASTRLLKK